MSPPLREALPFAEAFPLGLPLPLPFCLPLRGWRGDRSWPWARRDGRRAAGEGDRLSAAGDGDWLPARLGASCMPSSTRTLGVSRSLGFIASVISRSASDRPEPSGLDARACGVAALGDRSSAAGPGDCTAGPGVTSPCGVAGARSGPPPLPDLCQRRPPPRVRRAPRRFPPEPRSGAPAGSAVVGLRAGSDWPLPRPPFQ